MLGKVCFYSARGWGFLRPEQEDLPDLYFHHSGVSGGIHRKLAPDLTVEFDIAERSGKPLAVNVRIPDNPLPLEPSALRAGGDGNGR